MREVKLRDRSWTLGPEVGSGGFGVIVEAASEGMGHCVAKFVPKDPGAGRELLFVDLDGVRNVVPVIDSGEAGDQWILVMPRAERSLRDRLEAGDNLPAVEAAAPGRVRVGVGASGSARRSVSKTPGS